VLDVLDYVLGVFDVEGWWGCAFMIVACMMCMGGARVSGEGMQWRFLIWTEINVFWRMRYLRGGERWRVRSMQIGRD